ncbi:Regulator of nonsense transcripts 1 [Histomonas meleagridis]|uniref:Regulator of nonsense transcripts 1 n=1 Tax=Histomonas meleagridis TaxID=135588 RepID=UPI0035598980|nr:Regulator of nonsense transcripts 1 [Histomonas meleagridis]KAH0804791.1 Regulator of nonsense transcripts 1 [Histomonas meleagridis]
MSTPKCEYCGCTNESCLAQCAKTGLYFCNGKGQTKSSHIVHHLKTMKYDQIVLPESNKFRNIPLQCFVCGSTNIFNLGFLFTKDRKQIYISCRHPCRFDSTLTERNVDTETFTSIISGGYVNTILKIPTPEEYTKIPMNRVMAVSDAIREKLGETNDKIQRNNSTLLQAKIQYESREEFYEIMKPFIETEKEESRQLENSQKFSGISLKWESDTICYFTATPTLYRLLSLGISLGVSCENVTETAIVNEITKTRKVTIQFQSQSMIKNMGKNVTISILFNEIPFKRQLDALQIFKDKKRCMNSFIANVILGNVENFKEINQKAKRIPLVQPKNGFPELNNSQMKCASVALSRRFSLIQGPPGTGKTTVIAVLAYSLVQAGIKPVLLCTQSNVATDFLTLRVAQTGLQVCRVLSSAREQVDSEIKQYTTKNLAIGRFGNPETPSQMTKNEIKVVANCDVVCTTCASAGGARLSGAGKFSAVIFDEAGQCVDPDILIPLVYGAQKVILVGDHKQLGPIVLSPQCKRARYDMPIMQRLILQGVYPLVLRYQYRMHPGIAAFSSQAFYANLLENGITAKERTWPNSFLKWPNPEVPMFFWNVNSQEEIYENGLSYVNRHEGGCVSVLLDLMWKSGVKATEIGIITPYAGQQAYLMETLPMMCSINDPKFFDDLEIASVDAFQGHEKNFIILSNVRANDAKDIGFLRDKRRLCVSLTRAKYGLIVIGCANTYSDNPLWCKYIEYCKSINVFVEGKINSLTPSTFTPTYTSSKENYEEEEDE